MIVFLASPAAGYITGQTIVIDGGSVLPSLQSDALLRAISGPAEPADDLYAFRPVDPADLTQTPGVSTFITRLDTSGHRCAGGGEGRHRRGRGADDRREPGGGRAGGASGGRRGLPGRVPRRGRPHRRQDQPARALLRAHRREPVVRHAGEPLRRRPACRAGRRAGPAWRWPERRRGRHRARHRHRRVDPQPGCVVRGGRPEDDLRPHPGRRHVAAGALARHDRADGGDRRPGRRGDGDARARASRRPVRRPRRIGRVRGLDAEPWIDAAVDAALRAAGFEVEDVVLPGWAAAHDAGIDVLFGEACVPTGPWSSGPATGSARRCRGAWPPAARWRRRSSTRRSRSAGPVAGRAGRRPSSGSSCSPCRQPSGSPAGSASPVAPNPMAVAVNLAGHPALARAGARARRVPGQPAAHRARRTRGAARGGRGDGRGGRGRLERVLISRTGVPLWCKRSVAASRSGDARSSWAARSSRWSSRTRATRSSTTAGTSGTTSTPGA